MALMALMAAPAQAQANCTLEPAAAELHFGEGPLELSASLGGEDPGAWTWTLQAPAGGCLEAGRIPGKAAYYPPFVLEPTAFTVRATAMTGAYAEATVTVHPHKVFTRNGPLVQIIDGYLPGWNEPRLECFAGDPADAGAEDRDGGPAIARFHHIRAVISLPGDFPVPDLAGHWLVTSGSEIRSVSPDGQVRPLAGSRDQAGRREGIGAEARFRSPHGLALAPRGATGSDPLVYMTDTGNSLVWAMDATGRFRVHAGGGRFTDEDRPLPQRNLFWRPMGLAVDPQGRLCVADDAKGRILRLGPDRQVAAVPGQGHGAGLDHPSALDMDPETGDCLVWDRKLLKSVDPHGVIRALADPGSLEKPIRPERGLVVRNGRAFLADPNGNRILRYDLRRRRLETLVPASALPGTRVGPLREGSAGAALEAPVCIAFSETGECVVASDTALFRLVLSPALPAEDQKYRYNP